MRSTPSCCSEPGSGPDTQPPATRTQHGTADSVVPPGQGESLLRALQAAGVPAEWRPVEGADHCFIDGDTSPIMPAVVDFLGRYLR